MFDRYIGIDYSAGIYGDGHDFMRFYPEDLIVLLFLHSAGFSLTQPPSAG
jgi:hypothetical protein